MQVAYTVLNTAKPLNASFNSPALPIPNAYGYAIQAVYTGTINGSFKLQASADQYNQLSMQGTQPPVPTNWTDIASTSVSETTAGTYIWNVTGAFYNYVRVVFTDASGGTSTGTVTITANTKA